MKLAGSEGRVRVLEGQYDVAAVARKVIATEDHDESFYIQDLGDVVQKFYTWKRALPRVEPFYAVKCNEDPLILTTLAALGTGFDCASKMEIRAVRRLGVSPERIIFANPTKMMSHIHYAGDCGVRTVTFDNETELIKMKRHLPDAKLVLRIRCDAADALLTMGSKFGSDPITEAPGLLSTAYDLGLSVVGVSFHVGTGCLEPAVYERAIRYSRTLFDLGTAIGHDMRLLDIGGGFPGNADTSFYEIAAIVNAALDVYFPEEAVRVVAEPGRYFVASAATLAVQIHSKREVESGDGSRRPQYYVTDGVFGSFNSVLTERRELFVRPLENSSAAPAPCSVWGPSCDSMDCIFETCLLPPMGVGDWLLFPDMGAYSLSLASTFNGFPLPGVLTVAGYAVWKHTRWKTFPYLGSTAKERPRETLSSQKFSVHYERVFKTCAASVAEIDGTTRNKGSKFFRTVPMVVPVEQT